MMDTLDLLKKDGTAAPMAVLIVEDSATQAMKLRFLLEKEGFRPTVARDGLAALDVLQGPQPGLIISDIVMPGMDGYELCRRVKADPRLKAIPVMLLTSLSDPHDVIRGLEAGADNFVTKPYDPAFLLSRIRHILINQEMRRSGSAQMGVEVFFAGERHFLTAERIQIVDLLLSTFDNAVQKNRELERSNRELQEAIDTIRALEVNYRQLLETISDAILVVDETQVVRFANPAAAVILDRTPADMIGRPTVFPVVMGQRREIELKATTGRQVIADLRVADTLWEGQRCLLASLRDVTDTVLQREKLRQLSLRDDLTQLYNRRGFALLAEQRLRAPQSSGLPWMVFYADLDGMKSINDTLGHSAGDEALVEAAEVLGESFRSSDLLGRMGGDEFAAFALPATPDLGEYVLRRIEDLVAARNAVPGRRFRLSLSLGWRFSEPAEALTLEAAIAEADGIMYEAKRQKKLPGTRGPDIEESPGASGTIRGE